MTKAQLNLMVRVFKRRMDQGETFDEILEDYPKLTEKDIKQLKDALGIKDGENNG